MLDRIDSKGRNFVSHGQGKEGCYGGAQNRLMIGSLQHHLAHDTGSSFLSRKRQRIAGPAL